LTVDSSIELLSEVCGAFLASIDEKGLNNVTIIKNIQSFVLFQLNRHIGRLNIIGELDIEEWRQAIARKN
jgi:hypothetical protein